jgi:GT2 family glycosyltransferase
MRTKGKTMPDKKELLIVIVTWNQKKLTLDCLETVFASPPAKCSYEVVLVDNASSDNTVAAVKERFPAVCIIENKENIGLVKANNLGMKSSDSDFIVLMNNDTLVKPGCFDNLYEFIKDTPDAGIVGAKLFYGDGTLQMSCFRFPTIKNALFEALGLASLFPKSKIFGEYEMSWWDHNSVKQVDWVSTACYIARREAFEKVGYIDPVYFVYADDVDMGFKMKKAGYKVYFIPSAKMIHLSGRNVSKPSKRKSMEGAAALRYTMKKNNSYLYYSAWKTLKIMGFVFKLIKWQIKASRARDQELRKTDLSIVAQFQLTIKYYLLPLCFLRFSSIKK